jgi:hypothetical protein
VSNKRPEDLVIPLQTDYEEVPHAFVPSSRVDGTRLKHDTRFLLPTGWLLLPSVGQASPGLRLKLPNFDLPGSAMPPSLVSSKPKTTAIIVSVPAIVFISQLCC